MTSHEEAEKDLRTDREVRREGAHHF